MNKSLREEIKLVIHAARYAPLSMEKVEDIGADSIIRDIEKRIDSIWDSTTGDFIDPSEFYEHLKKEILK